MSLEAFVYLVTTMDSDTVDTKREERDANIGDDGIQAKVEEASLKYDSRGMLLIPQPTDRPDDPLVRHYPYHGDNRANVRTGDSIENL